MKKIVNQEKKNVVNFKYKTSYIYFHHSLLIEKLYYVLYINYTINSIFIYFGNNEYNLIIINKKYFIYLNL